MTEFAQVGDFCPNETCSDYGKRQGDQQRNIIRYGKTKAGRQRYECKTCGQTFTETKGTLFYRRRTPEDEIIDDGFSFWGESCPMGGFYWSHARCCQAQPF